MNRQEFMMRCIACTGTGWIAASLLNCSGKIIPAQLEGSDLILPEKEFEILKNNELSFRSFVVAQNDLLEYPICVYRLKANEYSALWMKCSHQGTELQALGDRLHCPAHGSEFNKNGGVENGPAGSPLRTFPVAVADGRIKVSLK